MNPFHNSKSSIIEAMLLLGYGLFCFTPSYAQQRSFSEVEKIAYKKMSEKRLYAVANSKHKLKICLKSSQLEQKSISLPKGKEAFFVFNVEGQDSEGFVIVSADYRMPEVLGYSYSNSFNKDSICPSTRYLLECFMDSYLYLQSHNLGLEPLEMPLSDIRPEGVEPILGNLPWGQGNPFNQRCPLAPTGKCVTGCVATAMAQVMWLHQWPDYGRGNISYTTSSHHLDVSMNLSENPIQWNLIKEDYRNGNYTDEEAYAVATLMSACGVSVHMDYSPSGSGAYQEDILKALVSNFNYDPDAAFLSREYFTTTDWNRLLVNELNEGRAVNYAGNSSSDGGHSFVIDGYDGDSDLNNLYYHLNWGWDGRCNGYYLLPRLLPHENGEYYVHEGFNDGQQMLIGICPNNGMVEPNKMMISEGLRVIQGTLLPGDSTTLKIKRIVNFCYRTFSGEIGLQLTDLNGNTYIIAKISVNPIQFMDDQKDLSIPFSIPDSIAYGKYAVKLVSINSENYISEVYSRSYPQITIMEDQSVINDTTDTTILCSSEYEVIKNLESDSLINVRVYELYNYSEEFQEGDIQLEIASTDGIPIMNVGTPLWISRLGAVEVAPKPLTLTCTLPDTLSNGDYRLYVLYYPSEKTSSFRVKLYSRMTPQIKPTEYFLPLSVTDDKIIIGKLVFDRKTSNIRQKIEYENIESYYTLYGLKCNPSKGMFIVNRGGKTFKVFVK